MTRDPNWNPKKLTVRHEMIMDYMILNPAAKRAEIAEAFECHENTLGLLINSDTFQYALRARRERMEQKVEQTAFERLQGKVARLATASVEKLTDAVESGKADLDGIRDTCDMALKALGYGGAGPAKPSVTNNVQVVVVDSAALAEARARMRAGAPSALTVEHGQSALPAA